MRNIYSLAELVAVWLGQDDENHAFRAFCAVSGIASGDQVSGRPVGAAYFFGRSKLYYTDSKTLLIEDSETCKAVYFYLVGECYHHDYMGGLFGSNNNAKARAALAKQTFEIH